MSCEPLSRSNAGMRTWTTSACRRVIATSRLLAETRLDVVVGEQVAPVAVTEVTRPARTMVEHALPGRVLEWNRGLVAVAGDAHRGDRRLVPHPMAARPRLAAPLAEERAPGHVRGTRDVEPARTGCGDDARSPADRAHELVPGRVHV